MNEFIKIKARYSMQGSKGIYCFYLLAALIAAVYFTVSGYAADFILTLPTVQTYLTGIFPFLPQIVAITLCVVNTVFFTGFVSALLLNADSIFASNALFKKRPHDWFNLKGILKSARLFTCLFLLKTAMFAAWLALPSALSALLIFLLKAGEMNRTFLFFCAAGIALLFAAGLFFYTLSAQDLICARFLLAAHPYLSAGAAISMSRKKVRGSRLALLTFRLSFLPWLAACIFGFPVFYLWPYYRQSLACYVLAD